MQHETIAISLYEYNDVGPTAYMYAYTTPVTSIFSFVICIHDLNK